MIKTPKYTVQATISDSLPLRFDLLVNDFVDVPRLMRSQMNIEIATFKFIFLEHLNGRKTALKLCFNLTFLNL